MAMAVRGAGRGRHPAVALLRRVRAHGVWKWVARERGAAPTALRATAGCLIAWGLAQYVFHVKMPILAPVGVLMTTAATAYGTAVRALQQVGAAVLGFGAAFALVALIGNGFAAMAVLVFLGLVVSRLVRLPAQNVQLPVTALLVLTMGSGYGLARFLDVVLGAAVGLVVNILFWPPRHVERAAADLADAAEELAVLLDDMAGGVRDTWDHADSRGWLDRARDLTLTLTEARESAEEAEESLKLTPARRRLARRLPRISAAAAGLDHVTQQVRGIARALNDMAVGERGLPRPDQHPLPPSFADLLTALSRALAAFGRMQIRHGRKDLARLREALEQAAYRQRVAERELRARGGERTWSVYGALLDDCARLRYELGPEGPHRKAISV
ncbi:FUSC family protein [Bailinhaonella thermotolerans]|uniref:Aromatic acid exporter family member 1 n=1 Tax=Bailinhaonella thermotolerans TaxID=1070861 RepID=A0A3A4ADH0_9ACTN|nr:hypothetical protein [Bailinhaonella thermotolerans]RJL24797.1 hypothetical protein D5H75_28875 [Bailinhaonella thermotolerans]